MDQESKMDAVAILAQDIHLRPDFDACWAHVNELNRCSSEFWWLMDGVHRVIVVGLARVTCEVLVLSSIPITMRDVCA